MPHVLPTSCSRSSRTVRGDRLSIHAYSARTINGKVVSLDCLRGRVCLVVNTASECGYTPQLEGLETLYRRLQGRGFTILGFPCNQFGQQEPGDEAVIEAFCSRSYGITFPLFAKIEVKGPGAHPVYRYLTSARRGLIGTRAIKWNFTKFLVGPEGTARRRYGPGVLPSRIEPDILALLAR